MKGIPLRIEIGPKDLEKNQVTFARRHNRQKDDQKNTRTGRQSSYRIR